MAPKIAVKDIELSGAPRSVPPPFRFGAVTVNEARTVVRAKSKSRTRTADEPWRTAELMVPKWFNKDPAFPAEETVEQLRRSALIARGLYLGVDEPDTAFGLACGVLRRCRSQNARAKPTFRRSPPHSGAAEIDKAVLDALLRVAEVDFFSRHARQHRGLDARLTRSRRRGHHLTSLGAPALVRALPCATPLECSTQSRKHPARPRREGYRYSRM